MTAQENSTPRPITFDDARARVRAKVSPGWTNGTLYVSPDGFEDAEGYLVNFGAREWFVDHDHDFADISNTATIVDRLTGYVDQFIITEIFARLDKMTVVTGTDDNPPSTKDTVRTLPLTMSQGLQSPAQARHAKRARS